jgi:N-acetylglucosamine-6-phosphate deacetylase
MPQIIIKNAHVLLSDRVLEKHTVLFQAGNIVQVAPSAEISEAQADQVIDAKGRYLAPGFIDLHIHGVHSHLIDNGCEDLAAICSVLPQYGVTSFLPTVCPLPKGEDVKFLKSLASVKSEGTNILGFHLEGPFLALTGAFPLEALGQADKDRIKTLIEAAKPYRAIFSISPDLKDITELLPIMAANNTPMFITHTQATVQQTQMAIEAGARHATHFYDVFAVPQETDPGVRPCGAVEAILADPRVSVDFILDGEHVNPVAVKLALLCKGPDRVCLITDAMVGAGSKPGRYKFLEEEVEFTYEGGPARLTEKSNQPGSLDGSGLTMDRAVRNARDMLGIDLPQAVRMASANPAGVLGIDDRKGKIVPGYDADLVLLDEQLKVAQTWIGGRCCYRGKD